MDPFLAVLSLALMAGLGASVFQLRKMRSRLEDLEMRRQDDVESGRSQLQQIESAGSRLQTEYDELLRLADEAILVLDSSLLILRASDRARALFGESEGRTLIQATLSTELCEIAEAAQAGEAVDGREVRLPGTSGQVLIVSAAAVTESDGAARCLLVARDISELRRLETVRRDFVGNVSHELRTPLASIRAMAETLQGGALEDPEVAGKFLESIVRESDRLTRIAEDLLILSRAESGPAESDEVDLTALLNHVVEHMLPQAKQGGLEIRSSIGPGLKVAGSPDQLQQVFLNLVDNAVKYTPAGGSIAVTAEREGDRIVARVKDTGIGILSEHQRRIFERFYRADKGRSRASGGTGLGLAIVKHITESHGGTVSVESEFNRGSTFTVSLPAFAEGEERGFDA